MYYRTASFPITPKHEGDFFSITDSLRKKIKEIEDLPFVDYLKTKESQGMIITAYDNEEAVNFTEERFRKIWSKPQRSGFITEPPIISQGSISWML